MAEQHTICVLPGDGIGPEVIRESVRVLNALPASLRLVYGDIGYGCFQRCGTSLPDETITKVAEADATLLGAVETPPDLPGYSSPVVGLRRHVDLFANVRPCRSSRGLAGARPDVDLVVVRENTEGLYSQRERIEDGGDTAIGERVITRNGCERIARFAFSLAKQRGFGKVTAVHKANILRETCGLFRRVVREVAAGFPAIELQEMLVDNAAMQLVLDPSQFQVLVTTNLFGDILSDEACALVGGPGLACSVNWGPRAAVFEPVHRSAPDIAGRGLANPLAAILAASMLLRHLRLEVDAERVEKAVHGVLEKGLTTPDLGGKLSTPGVTEQLLAMMAR